MKPDELPETVESKTRPPQKGFFGNHSCLELIGRGIIFLGLLFFLTRFGYCRGWWLKANPFAYRWWLCQCGSKTEQRLYPEQIEIVVSACERPWGGALSADGRYMILNLKARDETYLYNLVTGEKQLWPYPQEPRYQKEVFITDTIIYALDRERQEYVFLDIADGNIIPSTSFGIRPQGENVNVPQEVWQFFQKAEQVVIRERNNVIIAVSKHPCNKSCEIYTLSYLSTPSSQEEQLKAILTRGGINYEIGRYCWWKGGCPSSDGRFIDGWGRLYRADDLSQPVVSLGNRPPFMRGGETVGWAYDDSGVYINLASYCIIEGGDIVFDDMLCSPSPIIKLKLPEEYLLPTQSF